MNKRPQLDQLFPDPAALSAGRRAHRVRRAVAGVGVLVLLSGGAGIAQAAAADPVVYRTATVGDHDVQSLLTTVGTVEAVSQAAVAFPTSGTVATVDVEVGDTVVVGETLATLDPTDLTEALHTTQAALAQAELVLSKALNGESTATVGAGSTGVAPSTGSSSSATTAAAVTTTTAAPATTPSTATDAATSPTSTDADAIRNAQQAVVDGQKAVDAALNEANQALAEADTVCADLDAALAALAATTPTTTTADPTTTTTTTTTAATTTTSVDTASCRTALAAVRSAQTAAATAQQQLARAATTLDDLLAASASTATSGSSATAATPTNTATTSTNIPAANAASANTASTSTASTSTASTVSSEELIADQKAVDAAAVAVNAAQQSLNQDVLVAPITGTVIGVELTVGDSVTAGSSTATITIVGDGGYEVTTTVSVDDVTDLAVGQSATFLVDGSADELNGEIVSIGVAPASGSTSYPVTIALSSPADDLRNGATGTVAIVTAATTEAPSVPTSAVATDGDRHTVTVLSGTTTEEVAVEVGVVGATWTEVTSGLDDGDEVVLASLAEALPGSATDTGSSGSTGTSSGTAGAGGFTGGPPSGMGGPPAG